MSGTDVVSTTFLPTPLDAIRTLVQLLCSGGFFFEHLIPSVVRVALALSLAVAVSLPLGVLTGRVPSVAGPVHQICGFSRYLPIPALVPLSILWLGIGDAQKVAVIAFGTVFQLTLVIADHTALTPRELLETAQTFGLSEWQLVRRVVLPCALPAIWNDLRISAGWAWSYLVLAELVAGNSGLGYLIVQSQRTLAIDRVFATLVLIGGAGALTDLAFRRVGARLFPWA